MTVREFKVAQEASDKPVKRNADGTSDDSELVVSAVWILPRWKQGIRGGARNS